VFRKGIASWLLTTFLAPISRMKGSTDASAALGVLRAVKRGCSVCMFAEGNRSFTGLTGPIHPATGKLVKRSGATLVTFRITGGYLTTPRWGHTRRRGPLQGTVVRTYSPQTMAAMTPDQINRAIADDLHVDAFADQEPVPARYIGENRAEYLEAAFHLCPSCRKSGALHSQGNTVSCSCGMQMTVNEYGFLEGGAFSTPAQWDAWQNAQLPDFVRDSGDVLFRDESVVLRRVAADHREEIVSQGPLHAARDALVFNTFVMPYADISEMSICGRGKILFSARGNYYEAIGSERMNGRKYLSVYEYMTSQTV